MILTFLLLAEVISNYIRLEVAEIRDLIRHDDTGEGERDEELEVGHSDEGSSDENSNNLITAADELLQNSDEEADNGSSSNSEFALMERPEEEDDTEELEDGYIVADERGHVDVVGEDPTHLEVLRSQIAERVNERLPNGLETAIEQVVELAECFRNDGRSDLCHQHIRALVQYYIDHPLRIEEERAPEANIPFMPKLSSNPADVGPNEARERVKRLVNEALRFYCHQFRRELEDISVQEAVRDVLNLYLGCVGDIYKQCLRIQLHLEGDLQLAYLLANLKSITKRVGSLVSAQTEGKVKDLIKGRQLTKEVEDILTTVMSAVSKEVQVLMSINKKQMKSFLNKKRAGVDLTIVAFSPRLTEIERVNKDKVNKFLTTFQSHPHTHQALLQLSSSDKENLAEVDRGMYPYLHWLTRMSETYLQLGGWREHLQAHGLANFCAAADPENLLLIENVYNIESVAYDGQHPLTFSEYQKLTNQLKQQLWEYREETRLSFKALETVEQSLDVGDIFSQTSTEKALNFFSQVISASKLCSESYVKFTSSVMESSVQVLDNSGLSPPCSFVVIDLGTVARGEATPYSTLKYAFVVENESNMEYFHKLAMQTYFLITNMGETPLQHFGLDHLSDIGMVVADGYRIDGITDLSGSIPTGNGLVNGKSLILSVEGFVKLFEEESVTPCGNSLNLLSALTLLYAHQEGDDLYRRFVKERLTVEKELQNNSLASEKKLQHMSDVLDRCQLFSDLRYTPSHCRPVESMKSETLRYLTLLAESLQSFLALEVHYPWETWATLNEKGALSDLPHSYIKIALAMSIYICTCSSLSLKSQSDQFVLSISSSSTSSDTSSATPSAPTEQTDRYSIQRSSYILLSSLLLHAERFVRSELAKGYNELSALVNKFSLPKPSPLLKAEVLLSLGDYKLSLNQVHEVVEKAFVNSGCGTFVDVVSEKLNKDEGHADVRRYTELCACLLYLTQQYPGALNYSQWLVSHKTSELDGLEWKVVSAQCLRAGGSYQPACDHLLEVISDVKECLDMKQKENLSVQILQTLGDETEIGKRKLMLFEVTATAYAMLGIVYNDMTKDTEAEEYTLSSVLLFHSLINCNMGSRQRLWELIKYYFESITQEASQDILGRLEELYVNEPDYRACDNLAMMCFENEHFTKALKYWNMSLEKRKKLHGEKTNDTDIARCYNQIGRACDRMGQHTLAIEYHKKALEMWKACYGADKDHVCIASSYSNIGKVYCEMGCYELALECHNKSLEMRKALYGADENHRGLAISYNEIGSVYQSLGEHTLELEYQLKSLDMIKAFYGADTNHEEIAGSYVAVGNAYHGMGKYTEALDYYIKSVEMKKSRFGADANRTDIATCYSNIGVVHKSLGQLESAMKFHNKSLEMRKAIYGTDKGHSDIASSYDSIGAICRQQRRHTLAIDYHNMSLEMLKVLYGAATNHPAIARSYNYIAYVYSSAGKHTLAIEYYLKSLDMRKALYGADTNHTDIATSYNNIASVYNSEGKHTLAIKYYLKSLDMRKALHGADTNHTDIATSYSNIASVYSSEGKHNLAMKYYLKSLDMRKALYGADTNHPGIASSYNNIASVYSSEGKHTLAIEYHLKSLDMRKALYGADTNHTDIATSYNNLGFEHIDLEEYKKALEYLHKAVEMRKAVGPDSNHYQLATCYKFIGYVQCKLGNYTVALEYHIKSLEMERAVYGETTNHVEIAGSYKDIGHVYRGLGMYTTALEYYTKCLAMRKVIYSDAPDQPSIVISYYNIGKTYSLMGQHAVAYKFLELSIRTSPANDVSANIDISVTAASCCLHMKLWHKSWLYLYSALNRCLSLPQSQRQLFLTAKVHYYISLLFLHLGLTSLSLEHSLFSLNLSCVPLADNENITPEYVELNQDVQLLSTSLELVRDCWSPFGGS